MRMYKIPGRQVYCESVLYWMKEMAWIYIVLKIFKTDIEAIMSPVENGPK